MKEISTSGDDYPPCVRVESESGIAYYPKYKKNTKGKWELKDKSFQKLLMPHSTSKKPVKTDKD